MAHFSYTTIVANVVLLAIISIANVLAQETQDDHTLPADDNALTSLERHRNELQKQAEEYNRQMAATRHKIDMVRRVTRAKEALAGIKQRVTEAEQRLEQTRRDRDNAKKRKEQNYEGKEQIAANRRQTEHVTDGVREDMRRLNEQIGALGETQNQKEGEYQKMIQERDRLTDSLRQLGEEFKRQGFEKWIDFNSESLPVIVKATLVKTTKVLSPLAYGVESAAQMNDRLSREVAARLHRFLPIIQESPFYSGILFYILILCPTVLAAWLILKIHARLAFLTVAHYVVPINLYFGAMSVLCLLMSLISRTDILIVFRHRSPSAADTFMIVHAFLFLLHLSLHGLLAYVSRSSKDLIQFVSIVCVGLHFYVHAYKRAILDQNPNIGPPAYFLYALIFLYTLYDRGIGIIEAAVTDVSSGSNGLPSRESQRPLLPDRVAASKNIVYFAGLPVYSSAHAAAMDDPKSI